MVKLTENLWNQLTAQQHARDSAHRDGIRQAVATSDVPLPAELAEAVVQLNDKYTREIMRSHPGFALAERRDSYRTSLAIMEQCLEDLLVVLARFENEAVTDASKLFYTNDDSALRRFERTMQKELFACANAAASLVDHARRVDKCHSLPEYQEQRLACFGTDGLHDFVIALRVMLHHLHVVEAGWSMTTSYSEGTKTATFKLCKATVQRVIAASPERFMRPSDEAMLAYVDAASKSIDLREIFLDYRARIAKFHGWMKRELASDSLVALRDYDRILQEKVNADHRMQWKALMGNWLRWKVPPNPHNHLAKYLTPKQLEQVYALPRNSKEQVDLVIRFMDKEGAIDEALRKQAYELFERSPAPRALNL
ncbi:MAG: hypothetical protein HUU29_13960 [Planctomycetaceae bacterium]|nr:hypothetical protein [Planctomycetaceae bacterium]